MGIRTLFALISVLVGVASASTQINMGEKSVLPTTDSGNGNLLLAQAATLSQPATLKSLSFYVVRASGSLYLGVYDSTGPNGGPGNRVATTAAFTPVSGWNTAPVVSPIALAAGKYWLAYLPSSNALQFKVNTIGNFAHYKFYFGQLPAKFSTAPTNARGHRSFYATLDAAAAPPPSTSPSPTPAGFPDASNTGVPAGIVLKVVTGNQVFTTDGQVISGLDVHGKVIIKANDVTLKNSIVRGPAAGACQNGAAIETTGTGIVIQDVEVLMEHPTACLDGVWTFDSTVTILRANIYGGVDGVKTGSNIVIQDSYIHDMQWFASDPNQGGSETHNDGVQTFAGESNVTLHHNTIDLSGTKDGNSAWQGSGSNSRAEENYLDGGSCTLNFAAQSLGGAILQPIYVNNNQFGRHRGFAGCAVLISNKAVMTEYNGNVWAGTLQPVPPPQQHD